MDTPSICFMSPTVQPSKPEDGPACQSFELRLTWLMMFGSFTGIWKGVRSGLIMSITMAATRRAPIPPTQNKYCFERSFFLPLFRLLTTSCAFFALSVDAPPGTFAIAAVLAGAEGLDVDRARQPTAVNAPDHYSKSYGA